MVRGWGCARAGWLDARRLARLRVAREDLAADDLSLVEVVDHADLDVHARLVLARAALVMESEHALVVDLYHLVAARLEALGAGEVVGEAVEHLVGPLVERLVLRPAVVVRDVPDHVGMPVIGEAVEVEVLEGVEGLADDLLVARLAHLVREVSLARMSNKDSMKRFYEGVSAGELDVVNELLAEDFIEHDEFPGIPQSREGVKQFFSMAREAFPDLRLRILHLVEDGDVCVGHGLFEGTHEGDFMGVPPTGRRVSVPIADVVRFSADGRAVEHWGVTDTGMMMQQLGAVPEEPGSS